MGELRLKGRPGVIALASLVAFLGAACTGTRDRAVLEFRRAETAPGEGLTAAAVPGEGEPLYLHPTADVTAADVTLARLVTESREPDPVVELVFTPDGSRRMGVLTEEHHGKWFAIVLDGKVISAPHVQARVTGRVQITGRFTPTEAERLVRSVNER